jgi:hypothetical protein
MAGKKGKKKIKAPDLKPKKDAKGGIIGVLGPGGNPPSHNPPTGHGPHPHGPHGH